MTVLSLNRYRPIPDLAVSRSLFRSLIIHIVSRPKIAIFRKRLLSYTETFIADQGQMLTRFQPLYCGFTADRSGRHLIDSTPRFLLQDHCRFPSLSKFMFRFGLGGGRSWVNALAAESPRLVHAHFFKDGIDAVELGARLRCPVVTTLHGHDITKRNITRRARQNQQFFERVDCVIAVSRFIAEQALARGCPEHKLRQHYIGIDLERFSMPKRESERPSLLFVGRLVEKKGCIYLLEAMTQLQPKFPELELCVVGDGVLGTELQREAQARGLRVEFAGAEPASRIRERLARSWLFVAPSVTARDGDAEGLGMVFLEAQALQTPVVSFASGGVVEAVAHETTGLLGPERNVDVLANNIARLLEDSRLRQQMGLAGRRRVEAQFDIRKQCARLEEIYEEIC